MRRIKMSFYYFLRIRKKKLNEGIKFPRHNQTGLISC
ncbi:hypothetical protein D1BOALGB6SA_10589, partial [Olavius sp. associated proteobacterium Delta 1]